MKDSTMNESMMSMTSKSSHRSRHSSRKPEQRLTQNLLDSHTSESANGTSMDPPSTNLEIMAMSLQHPSHAELKRHKIKESLILATHLASTDSGQKNDTLHSTSCDIDLSNTAPSKEETLTTIVSTIANTNTRTESRHPSPDRERPDDSSNINIPQKETRGGRGGIGIGIVEVEQRSRGGSKQSFSTTASSGSDESTTLNTRPPRSVAASRASRKTVSSSSTGAADFKLSSERLEVLVMQLRETSDEKEAATIVLEFALRIKNHELVVQGADLSIINAMKRFSNSSKIQTRGCKALAEMASKGTPNILSIIDKGGSDIILTAMAKHRAEEDLQKEACRAIEYISRDSEQGKQSFGVNAKDAITAILHAMKDHPEAAKLQRMACRALASIAEENAQCSQCLVSRGGLDAIRRSLKNHDDNTDVIENAFDILINVASSVNRSALDEEIAMAIAMDRVLATMLLYRKNDKMQIQGMALLCILCKESHRNRARISSLYGLEVITKSMENCIINKEVQRHGATLIQYLCQSEGNAVAAGLISEGGMELLLNIIRRHGSDATIVQQVNLIIAKMARPFSDIIRKEGGIELILSGMRRHETNLLVQESACLALWKLSAKTENANAINGNGGVALINNALSRFATDENISEVACEALASLSHDKQMLLAQKTLKARAAREKPESSWGRWGCGVSCF